MIYGEKHIVIKDQSLVLNSQRALYWDSEKALIISDVHIGKTAHFRKHGIPISAEIQHSDLERLSFLIRLYQAKKLIVVGDLFHAEVNSDFGLFQKWRETHDELIVYLIKGNHDRLQNRVYEELKLRWFEDSVTLPPFKFIHDPACDPINFTICGHTHPGVSIKVTSGPRIKLPCFEVTTNQLILPAFSEFTGLSLSKPNSNSTFYAFTKEAFFEF